MDLRTCSGPGAGAADDSRPVRKRSTSLLAAPTSFAFLPTVLSHGWFDLPPFRWEPRADTLHRVIRTPGGSVIALGLKVKPPRGLIIRLDPAAGAVSAADRRDALRQVRHMLRLDEPLDDFHALCRRTSGYGWVARRKAGRLLRAPDPFEDLVKLICTTNCSWSLTRVMIGALVGGLGEELLLEDASDGALARGKPAAGSPHSSLQTTATALRAFPTPEAMAAAPPRYFRDTVRAGYRAPHLHDLARRIVAGEIAPSTWLDPRRDASEIQKEIRSVRGAGPYVAENMLKLLGRYEGLGLDSWCRRKFSEIHAGGRKVTDRAIERHYARFETWRGLALWCDLTRDWLDRGRPAPDLLDGQKY